MRLAQRTAAALGVLFLALLFCSISTPAAAQGFGLYEQGACMMGRAGAGVAQPCDDGSAIFFNPAALAQDTSVVVSGGVTGIAPRGTFTNSTTNLVSTLNTSTFYAPAFYAAAPVGRVVIGAGLFAPYGLTTDWPNSAEGRFLGYYNSLRSFYVQPTVAIRANDNVMVGAGVDITHTSLELRRRVDLASQGLLPGITFGGLHLVPPGTDFADVDLNGSGTHVGAHFGVLIKANDQFSIGARYLTRQTVDIKNGTVTTTQIMTGRRLPVSLAPTLPAGTPIDAIVGPAFGTGGPLSNQTATTSVPMPDQFVVGAAVKASDAVKLFVDYQYVHWALFDQIAIANQYAPMTTIVENYNDTHGVRIGGEFGVGRATLRAGFDAHTAASPDQSVTPLLPEAPRKEVALGASLPIAPRASIDLAYMYINQSDRAGRSTDGPNNGMYHYYGNLFGISFVAHF